MADSALRAFMVPGLKQEEVLDFPGLETFKDEKGNIVPIKVRSLGRDRISEIRKAYRTKKIAKDKKGKPIISGNMVVYEEDYDAEKATNHIIVEALAYPDLKDPGLMEYYGAVDVTEMPSKLFKKSGDFEYINKCIVDACGLGGAEEKEEEDTVEHLKN